jgi:hypothetical protein
MGVPTQVAGVTSTPAQGLTNGFIGWIPDAQQANYKVTGSQVSDSRPTTSTDRKKQFYR